MSQPSINKSFVLKKPPVVETVLGIQFNEIRGWKSIHHGLFYSDIRQSYPKYEQRGASPPIIESFPMPQKIRTLQLTQGVDSGCAQFFNQDESLLMEIQANRFSYHWRHSEDGTYPRYSTNHGLCKTEFERFLEFCKAENLGEIEPVLCEVMYFNKIPCRAHETPCELFSDVFSSSVGEFELLTLNRTYVLGDNRGRLYTEINLDMPEARGLTYKLTSRMHHSGDDAMATMQEAHDFLIKTFQEQTSDEFRRERWQEQ